MGEIEPEFGQTPLGLPADVFCLHVVPRLGPWSASQLRLVSRAMRDAVDSVPTSPWGSPELCAVLTAEVGVCQAAAG